MPGELLSENGGENCLDRVRDYFAALRTQGRATRTVKMFVLGNGGIGKTQLSRMLHGLAYDDKILTTHGVEVHEFDVPGRNENGGLCVRLWDFGGQDLYHGTHALFLRSHAIYLIAWTPARSDATSVDIHGYETHNQPLDYWLHYVQAFGGPRCPLLLVETQSDRKGQPPSVIPARADLLAAFPSLWPIAISAKAGRNGPALVGMVAEAAEVVMDLNGYPVVPESWAAGMDAIGQMTTGAAPTRFLTRTEFEALCATWGVGRTTDTFLYYLNAIGALMYDRSFFKNRIILDQRWALDAIYAVFDRERVLPRLMRARGRFSVTDLADWAWTAKGYDSEDQALFLTFMQSCGICFPVDLRGPQVEYIAVSALPARDEIASRLERGWMAAQPALQAVFSFDLLHDAVIRGIVAELGERAGLDADYWRTGVQFYDETTRCRARIEHVAKDGWAGDIVVDIQDGVRVAPGPDAQSLLDYLTDRCRRHYQRWGLKPISEPASSPPSDAGDDGTEAEKDIRPAPDPGTQRAFFISYAWGDETPEGLERAKYVDDFVAEARRRGVDVDIDKTSSRPGDSVHAFMDRLSRGDRVYVFLSEKYLRSFFCMTELANAWTYAKKKEEDFLKQIRCYIIPGTSIYGPADRQQVQQYWHEEMSAFNTAAVKAAPYYLLDDDDTKEARDSRNLHRIATSCYEILAIIADRVQEPNFQDFCDHGLSDV